MIFDIIIFVFYLVEIKFYIIIEIFQIKCNINKFELLWHHSVKLIFRIIVTFIFFKKMLFLIFIYISIKIYMCHINFLIVAVRCIKMMIKNSNDD